MARTLAGAVAIVLFVLCVLPCRAAGDDRLALRELENTVYADAALAIAGSGPAVFRAPLPSLPQSASIDGALDDPAWQEATSLPLPYVRPEMQGPIVGQATLLAFRGKDRLWLAVRFPSRRASGLVLSLEGPGLAQRGAVALAADGRVTLSPSTAVSPLRSAAARVAAETTVEMELALPEGEFTVRLPGAAGDDRPLGDIAVRLAASAVAWRVQPLEASDGRGGWRASMLGRQSVARVKPTVGFAQFG